MTKYKVIISSLLLLIMLLIIILEEKDNKLKQARWLTVTQYEELQSINNKLVKQIIKLQDFEDLKQLKDDLGK